MLAILERNRTGRAARIAVILMSIAVLLTLAPGLSAQSPSPAPATSGTSVTLYRNHYQGEPADTSASDIAPTADGGYVAAGVTSAPAGHPVGWVLKLNESGSAQWSVEVGGRFTYPTSIEQTADGGYVVAGGTQGGSGSVCDPLSGLECAWIAKLDAGGSVQWQRVYATGDSGLQVAWEVRQAADGGYVVAGVSGQQVQYGAWVAKLDPAGDVEWQKVFGGTSQYDLANFESVAPTADGGVAAAGWDTAGYDPSGYQRASAFVVRLDSEGTVLWQTQYSNFDGTGTNIGGSRAESIVQAPDGGYVVGGSWVNPAYPSGNDFLLLKLGSEGDIEWQTAYDGGVGCFDYIGRQCVRLGGVVYELRRSPDGGYLLSGIGHADPAEAEPYVQAWLGKVDPRGTLLWQHTFWATYSANALYGVGATADGGVVAIGTMAIYDGGSSPIQDALYIVKTDAGGNVANCGQVHGAAPLTAIDPSLVAGDASLPISTTPGSSAVASGSPLQTSVGVVQACGGPAPPPAPPGLSKKPRPKKK